jgi:hypothetical protein
VLVGVSGRDGCVLETGFLGLDVVVQFGQFLATRREVGFLVGDLVAELFCLGTVLLCSLGEICGGVAQVLDFVVGPLSLDSQVAKQLAEILAVEDLGLVATGEGGPATEQGRTDRGGECVVNPSGGLKGKGHPLGATGVAQVAEIHDQLLSRAGDRQIADAETGLTHNVGGSGATCAVHVLERGGA